MRLQEYITKLSRKINDNDIDKHSFQKYTQINKLLLALFEKSNDKVYNTLYVLTGTQYGGDIKELDIAAEDFVKEADAIMDKTKSRVNYDLAKKKLADELKQITNQIGEIDTLSDTYKKQSALLLKQLQQIAEKMKLFLKQG